MCKNKYTSPTYPSVGSGITNPFANLPTQEQVEYEKEQAIMTQNDRYNFNFCVLYDYIFKDSSLLTSDVVNNNGTIPSEALKFFQNNYSHLLEYLRVNGQNCLDKIAFHWVVSDFAELLDEPLRLHELDLE